MGFSMQTASLGQPPAGAAGVAGPPAPPPAVVPVAVLPGDKSADASQIHFKLILPDNEIAMENLLGILNFSIIVSWLYPSHSFLELAGIGPFKPLQVSLKKPSSNLPPLLLHTPAKSKFFNSATVALANSIAPCPTKFTETSPVQLLYPAASALGALKDQNNKPNIKPAKKVS